MEALLAGLVLIILGTLVAVFGVRIFYVLLPVWGFIAGFILGAQLVATLLGEGFLATVTGWIAGGALGLVFAVIAGVWFWAAIVVLSGTVGWAIATGIMHAIGIQPGLLTLAGGAVGAAALAILAIVIDAPTIYVAILSSFGGAANAVAGALLVLGRVGLDDLGGGALGVMRELPVVGLAWIGIGVVATAYQVLDARARGTDLRRERADRAASSA